MARPKTEKAKQRAEWFGFRLTLAERETINSAAANVGLSPSEYVRRCAFNGTVRVIHDKRKADPALMLNLLAIGNNLNQIARKLNATDRTAANLDDTIIILQELLNKVGQGYDS
jgi:hypothetical protein